MSQDQPTEIPAPAGGRFPRESDPAVRTHVVPSVAGAGSGHYQTTSSAADRFAAIMWGHFLDGCSIDGGDLQSAIEKSGLGESRPATEADIKGTIWAGEIEVGDSLTFLTPDGKACVNRGSVKSVAR